MRIKLLILFLCCLPIALAAQEVKPVISPDYLALIRNDSTKSTLVLDSTNNISKSVLRYRDGYFYQNQLIKNIKIGPNNAVIFQPASNKILYISGTALSSIEIQHVNHLPALQHQFVQGESANGTLAWKGPETNEMFNYGPSLNILEFDGNNYPYDVNGKLVANGMGSGIKAKDYNNSVFRTAVLFSNSITLQTKYQHDYRHAISTGFTAGQSSGNTFILDNKNKSNNISASLEATSKEFTISGTYGYQQQNFSNGNVGGFLNRVYQNAMLTPISFDNTQGNLIGNTQRSYSQQADNPYFLLDNNGHYFLQQQQNTSLSLEQKFQNLKIKLLQSYEKNWQQSNESYQPSTAFFPAGILIDRTANNKNYCLDFNTQYSIHFNNYKFSATTTANYIFKNNQSSINYLNISNYHYQRISNDAAISFSPNYRSNYFETGLNLTNKIYASNTATQYNFFLPSVSGFVRFPSIFQKLNLKISASYNRFNSELPINQSFTETNLLQYPAGDAFQYSPIKEVESFNHLSAIEHKEYTAGLELGYRGVITFSADWFSRQTLNDIFPTINANQLQLQNLVNHRNQGIELQLSHYVRKRNFNFSNSISFVSYKTKVTDVKNGYDFTPIAGFADVHKAIVKDQPLGVIVGNTYLKDASKNVLIGADGFPLVNNSLLVIGNPNPDYEIKLSQHINLKKWDVHIDWEWRKGGDIWNGTQALLDFYGKSANSAELRNTTNYVFSGVQANGLHNIIPVSFYDPSQPISQNRWVRYGPSGVAETYIQKGDCIRLNNVGISYNIGQQYGSPQLILTLYAHNIIVWSAYKGADPNQLLNDQANGFGLDFFNLPSYRSLGVSASLKF